MSCRRTTNRPAQLLLTLSTLLLISHLPAAGAMAQQGPPPEEREAVRAIVDMLSGTDDASMERFAQQRLTPEYRARFAAAESGVGLLDHLRAVREASRGALGDIGLEMDDDGLLLQLFGERSVTLRVVLDGDYKITRLDVHNTEDGAGGFQAALRGRMRAIEALGMSPADEFIAEHLAPSLTSQLSADELDSIVSQIRRAAATAGSITIDRSGDGYLLRFSSGSSALDVQFSVQAEEPFLIDSLSVETDVAPREREAAPAIAWDALGDRLNDAANDGFSGTVLAIRDGRTVLNRSYGASDQATGRANTAETIYGLGSIPIDFTRAAIFLLMQQGELDLDDPITRFFADVPADKQTLTIRHLLTGQSGLPNFHHLPEDADRDLTWIDRATAEQRILSAPLLFAPGQETAPSHSAYVLLSAVIERVSGLTYPQFLAANFFDPLGLEATGPYGDDLGQPRERFATGYGSSSVGSPNIPPNWGPTSWLVMGSGGMVSNPAEMHRWFSAMLAGEFLQGEALDLYLRRRTAIGGSDRGFFFMHSWDGDDTMIYVAMNAGADTRATQVLRRSLMDLVLSSES